MKQLILLFCFFFIIACKFQNKNVKTVENEDSEIIINNKIKGNQYFEVILDVIVKKDDKFHLFYKDFNNNGYSSERVSESIVQGGESNQKILFSIPEGIVPNGLRLDFGVNYEQEPIIFNNLTIRYFNKEFYFKNKFAQLFKPNKFASYNEIDKLIITKPIDGNYDPNFVSISLEDITFPLID